jgi:hypothetical protein
MNRIVTHEMKNIQCSTTVRVLSNASNFYMKNLEQQHHTYRTDVHFTIEEMGIKGILQMDGFTVPNPSEANRYSIWFTGGRIYALNGHCPRTHTNGVIFSEQSLAFQSPS